jgi:hypothetical protein
MNKFFKFKKINFQKIEFIYHDQLAYEMGIHPQPAKNFIPKWHKDMKPYHKNFFNPDGKKIIVENRSSNASAKKCTPMLDSIISGYIVPLWCDVQIRQTKNQETKEWFPSITWRIKKDVFELHGPSSREIPAPFGYDQEVFKFITWFRIKTPKGYSVMVHTPSGHYNLPFYAIPAIIDSDKSVIDNNFPCWIQKGFEGIVEKGTPMAQVTPFKRINWKANASLISYEEHIRFEDIGFNSNILNNYVKNIWSKKEYL